MCARKGLDWQPGALSSQLGDIDDSRRRSDLRMLSIRLGTRHSRDGATPRILSSPTERLTL